MESSNFLQVTFHGQDFFCSLLVGLLICGQMMTPKNQRKLIVNYMYNIPTKNSDSPV